MKSVQVQVEWKTKTTEQLDKIKAYNKYSTIIKFMNDPNWIDTAWSVVLSSFKTLEAHNLMNAEMRFLSDEGPEHFLVSGNKFELYEGSQCVLNGKVV